MKTPVQIERERERDRNCPDQLRLPSHYMRVRVAWNCVEKPKEGGSVNDRRHVKRANISTSGHGRK